MIHLLRVAFLIGVILFSGNLKADSTDVTPASDKIGLELYAGYGWMNNSRCRQALSISASYRNFVLTGRSYRNDFKVFENSWLIGYRVQSDNMFFATLSFGLSDVAFLDDAYVQSFIINPAHYNKVYGAVAQLEAEARIFIHRKPTRFGIAGAYAYHINSYRNLSVASVGLKFHIMPWEESGGLNAVFYKRQQERAKRRAERDANGRQGMPKNMIRTKLAFSLAMGTFVEYERNVNDRFGFSAGLAIQYAQGIRFIYESVMGPEAYLYGGEVNAGVNIYTETNKGWWSFGLKGAYRHRENSGFYAYTHGDYRHMSMRSEDAVALMRFAYTWRKKRVAQLGWVLAIGGRYSYQEKNIAGWYTTPSSYPVPIPVYESGYEFYPVIQNGFILQFGW